MALVIAVGTALAIAGEDPLLSAVPAVIAALCVATFLVVIQAPDWIRRHLDTGPKWRRRLLAAPQALADGTHFTIELVQRRERGLWGTVFWWIFDFATLWACFWAFGGHPNVAGLVDGLPARQLGNLLPLPGGVGGVEGGMVGAAAAFDMDAGVALVAVLAYRAISVWLPAPPGRPGAGDAAQGRGRRRRHRRRARSATRTKRRSPRRAETGERAAVAAARRRAIGTPSADRAATAAADATAGAAADVSIPRVPRDGGDRRTVAVAATDDASVHRTPAATRLRPRTRPCAPPDARYRVCRDGGRRAWPEATGAAASGG